MTRQVWETLSLIVCVINYVSISQEAADPLAEMFLCTRTSIDKLYSCSSAQPNFSKGLPTNVISISSFPSLLFFKETNYINTCCVNFFFLYPVSQFILANLGPLPFHRIYGQFSKIHQKKKEMH